MTRQELMKLKDGTLVYNGRTEGIIRTEFGVKGISILLPIATMSNDAKDFDEKPEYWVVLED